MKRMLRLIAVVLALVITLTLPVSAAGASTYASSYFVCYSTYIHEVEDNHLQIWYDVVGTAIMQRIGVSEIVIKRSSDNQNWSSVYYYYPEDNLSMIDTNTGSHAG